MRAIFASLVIAFLAGTASAQSSQVRLGVGLSHLKAACAEQGEGPPRQSGVQAGDNIIVNYDQPQVRAATRGDLEAMRRSGASMVRSTLWFHHGEDVRLGRRAEGLGLLEATGGRFQAADMDKLKAFAGDVRDAGYGVFAIALSVQGNANPKCKVGQEEWGACYRPELFDLTWQATDQIAQVLLPLQRPGFSVLIDISPENCPSVGGALVEKNQADFTRDMAVRFAGKYPGGWMVSCGGKPVARGLMGLKSLEDIFQSAGVRPSAIDIHLYDSDRGDIDQVLGAGDRLARRYGAPLYVMETDADNVALWSEARRLRGSGRTPSLSGVSLWPKRAADACHISVSPPFDLSAFPTN
jgi:hypothetical protein